MDQDQYPVNLTIVHQEKYSRGLALATLLFAIPKAIMLIPHFIVIYLISIAAFIVIVIAQLVVLFTGKYPESMHSFVVGVMQWQVRVHAYFAGLIDKYPPFSLS